MSVFQWFFIVLLAVGLIVSLASVCFYQSNYLRWKIGNPLSEMFFSFFGKPKAEHYSGWAAFLMSIFAFLLFPSMVLAPAFLWGAFEMIEGWFDRPANYPFKLSRDFGEVVGVIAWVGITLVLYFGPLYMDYRYGITDAKYLLFPSMITIHLALAISFILPAMDFAFSRYEQWKIRVEQQQRLAVAGK